MPESGHIPPMLRTHPWPHLTQRKGQVPPCGLQGPVGSNFVTSLTLAPPLSPVISSSLTHILLLGIL